MGHQFRIYASETSVLFCRPARVAYQCAAKASNLMEACWAMAAHACRFAGILKRQWQLLEHDLGVVHARCGALIRRPRPIREAVDHVWGNH